MRLMLVAAVGVLAAGVAGASGSVSQWVDAGGGRNLQVNCAGQGAPTVVLSAGGGGSSADWRRVAPVVARTTRVCSWDRAASGRSGASPQPQDLVHTEADLEAALQGAGVTGPLVMVGHSYGGLETLVFADRHPDRVVGMVLVDPSYPDQVVRLAAAAPALMAYSTASDRRAFEPVRICVQASKASAAMSSSGACAALRAEYRQGLGDAPPGSGAERAYFETILSAFEARAASARQAINPGRTYGDLPMVVLGSGSLSLPGAPEEVRAEIPALQAELARAHRALAGLSSRGSYVRVPDSGHAIMLQKPGAVIEAIGRVIDAEKR